jgi:hypothetical protein
VAVDTQVILKVSDTLPEVDAVCIFPVKRTDPEPEEGSNPENIDGVKESDAPQEETSTPIHCKFIFSDNLITSPLTVAPLLNVKKIFSGPSELLACILTAAC